MELIWDGGDSSHPSRPRKRLPRAARPSQLFRIRKIASIINGQRSVTADTALRLGHWFGTSPEFWLNLQTLYELRLARKEVGDRVKKLPRLADHKPRVKPRTHPAYSDRPSRACDARNQWVRRTPGVTPFARLPGF